jgi:hypothetical protein
MTTTLVSVKTFFSSATRSAFCERSMPTPLSAPGGPEAEVQPTFPHHCEKAYCPWGWGSRALHQRTVRAS